MYKHRAMTVLSRMIKAGEVDPEVDIRRALKMFADHKRVRHTPNKNLPRFYQRAQTTNYRARKVGATGTITYHDLEAIWAQYGGKCKVCSKRDYLVFDHIVPYYRGGTNTIENLQLLCRLCNMEKGVNE